MLFKLNGPLLLLVLSLPGLIWRAPNYLRLNTGMHVYLRGLFIQ